MTDRRGGDVPRNPTKITLTKIAKAAVLSAAAGVLVGVVFTAAVGYVLFLISVFGPVPAMVLAPCTLVAVTMFVLLVTERS